MSSRELFRKIKKLGTLALGLIPETIRYKIFVDQCPLYPETCPTVEWSIGNLKKLGFKPHFIVDIGAYCGTWTTMVKEIYPEAQVLMFEPQQGKEKDLLEVSSRYNGSVKYSIELLSSVSGCDVDFYVMEWGSSVFQERSSVKRKKEVRKTVRLDELLRRFNWGKADFIKIDTQGYDLEVLKGAGDFLKTIDCVLMEVSLIQVNEGAPLFSEVIKFMEDRDFVFYDLCTLYRRPFDGALLQLDVIFLKKYSPLLKYKGYD